ncbi:MAG: hypothetical protein U5L03_09975 [Burkholderiaceae bacterium]|nr:hypothetical protein [Burkholderiaceae bacterium]
MIIGPAGDLHDRDQDVVKACQGRGSNRLPYWERLTAGGHEPDRNPVVQAAAQAGWLKELLAESTGRRFDVRPVVVFPGWFIEQTGQSTKKLWVLNPKALPGFLDNEGIRLICRSIKLASYHLSRHIRSERPSPLYGDDSNVQQVQRFREELLRARRGAGRRVVQADRARDDPRPRGRLCALQGEKLYYVGLASNLMGRVNAHLKDRHKGDGTGSAST